MADVVSTQIYDGARNCQFKLTNVSDGTGEVLVPKVIVANLTPNPGAHLKLRRVRYNIQAMSVQLFWDATVDAPILILAPGSDLLDFHKEFAGGWPNNGGAGATGNVNLTTIGQVAGSSYTIDLEFIKGI